MIVLFLIYATKCRILSLNDGWKFNYKDQWYPADVPSTIHLDLLKNNLIQDPYVDVNLLQMYDLELDDWEYTLNFSFSYQAQVNQLVFEKIPILMSISTNN
ncbi:hypothetical protein pb186bvf_001691 [Paramecium bursaria]